MIRRGEKFRLDVFLSSRRQVPLTMAMQPGTKISFAIAIDVVIMIMIMQPDHQARVDSAQYPHELGDGHSHRNCSASKLGVVCLNCRGHNHFVVVCRNRLHRASGQPTLPLDHAASTEDNSGGDFQQSCLDELVHALPSSTTKLFTTLPLLRLATHSQVSNFKWIQQPPAIPFHTTTS